MTSRPKLLVVDDREENLVAVTALLREQDADIVTARSGREALELLLSHDFALALVDVQMPEMDGYELADLMRGTARSRDVPIVFVTAGGRDASHVGRAYACGAVDFLPKPIDAFVLRCKVDVFLRLYRARQEAASRAHDQDRLIAELKEILRLNELFTAALGHDLRNPLGAILTGAELLGRRAPDERSATTAHRVASSARRMARMIEQLLDFARARLAGGIPLARSEVDLAEAARRITAEIQAASPERRVELTCPAELRGFWDGDRLAQVLSNLLGNAVRHGQGTGPVRALLEPQDDRAVVRVWNAGAIAPGIMPGMFEPFRSGGGQSRSSDGLGLGLYIVRQIVTAHAGEISVTSSDREGTTFCVSLPRHPARETRPPG